MQFFDHNATCPLLPEAKAAWLEAADAFWLNPSSPYRAAARVRARLEQAREELAGLLGLAEPDRIVFTSGATEGNNAVFAHWRQRFGAGAPVLVSPTEHPSVLESARTSFPDTWSPLPLDASGAVDTAAAKERIGEKGVRALSAMAANNETGLLNDWATLADLCRSAGIAYHCDASQWVGRLPLDGLAEAGFVTACAHKFGGPRGVGFTVLPVGEAPAFRSLRGGQQQSGHRAGTEDVAGVLALLAALRSRIEQIASAGGRAGPRDRFEAQIVEALPGTRIVGAGRPRLWNTSCLLLPPPDSTRWIRALERSGYLVSSGSACSTGKEGPSYVLAAMGIPPEQARRALRLSSGSSRSDTEWDGLRAAMKEAASGFAAEQVDGPGSTQVISLED